MTEEYSPAKPMGRCEEGHSYPLMAGACPYCEQNMSLASAKDADGNERFPGEPAPDAGPPAPPRES